MTDSEKVDRLEAFLRGEGYDPKEAIEVMVAVMVNIVAGSHVPLSRLAEDVAAVIMGYHGEFPSGDLTRPN